MKKKDYFNSPILIKNQKLRELATLVDNSFDGKTRGNGMIDNCELSVFIDKVKTAGMESECSELLCFSKTLLRRDINQESKALKDGLHMRRSEKLGTLTESEKTRLRDYVPSTIMNLGLRELCTGLAIGHSINMHKEE